MNFGMVGSQSAKVCFDIGRNMNNKKLPFLLMQGATQKNVSMAARLVVTMKPRASNGVVLHRDIHAASSFYFAGLYSWLNMVHIDLLKQSPPRMCWRAPTSSSAKPRS